MKNNFKENEELDIIVLIEKIKLMLLSLFLQIFRRFKNFLSEWQRLLAVIFVGVLLGYFLTDNDKPSSKEATVLVKINFDAGNYVYDTVDLINLKISSEDTDFFTQEIKLNDYVNEINFINYILGLLILNSFVACFYKIPKFFDIRFCTTKFNF